MCVHILLEMACEGELFILDSIPMPVCKRKRPYRYVNKTVNFPTIVPHTPDKRFSRLEANKASVVTNGRSPNHSYTA